MIKGVVGGRGDAVGVRTGTERVFEVQIVLVALFGRQLKAVAVVTGTVVVMLGLYPCHDSQIGILNSPGES